MFENLEENDKFIDITHVHSNEVLCDDIHCIKDRSSLRFGKHDHNLTKLL